MLEGDTIRGTVVRCQEATGMDDQLLLNSALTRKNTELFNRPGEGVMESAHSLKAMHGVFTENTQV